MFLKIRIRNVLLRSFQGTRFSTNPYALHPLADYVYYEALNTWLSVLKEMKKEGASIEEITMELVTHALYGHCPNKLFELVNSNQEYTKDDLIDENLVAHVDSLCEDERLKTMMIGGVSAVMYGHK